MNLSEYKGTYKTSLGNVSTSSYQGIEGKVWINTFYDDDYNPFWRTPPKRDMSKIRCINAEPSSVPPVMENE